MKKKILYLEDGNNNTKFILTVELDNLTISIFTKKNEYWTSDLSKDYKITNKFNIEELVEKFYEEYVEKKNIELIWTNGLKPMEIIELNDID